MLLSAIALTGRDFGYEVATTMDALSDLSTYP